MGEIGRPRRGCGRGWLLAAALLIASTTSPVDDARAATAGEAQAVRPTYDALDPRDDPRLRRTGPGEQALREMGDAVFARPIHFVRLVVGVAMLPVALPAAAILGDWRDALDVCVTGPFAMVFQRPLDR